jgi:putative ABC transport system permease protein
VIRVAWRSLLAHKGRLLLTLIAIVVGVAFVAGTFVFTDTLGNAFNKLTGAQPYDVSVQPSDRQASSGIGLPESLVAEIKALPDVAAVDYEVQSFSVIPIPPSGKVPTTGAPKFGISWPNDISLTNLQLALGRPPQAADEIALDTHTAEKNNWALGDTVTVAVPTGSVKAKLVGTFDMGVGSNLGVSFTAFEFHTAQKLFALEGKVTAVRAKAKSGVSQTQLQAEIKPLAPAGAQVLTGVQSADQNRKQLNTALNFINILLLVFALIAVFVGSFIIVNTFQMLVAQRQREMALLRAIGASRRQVTMSVMLEALVLGLVASTVGLLAGIGLAVGLHNALAALGAELPYGGVVVSPKTIIASYLVGVTITVVSALMPAVRAGRTRPIAAMRVDTSTAQGSLRNRGIAGGILLAIATAFVVYGFSQQHVSATNAALGIGLGALVALIAMIVLAPLFIRPFVGVLSLPFRKRPTGKLATGNVKRSPRRTAATASALTIGLAIVGALATLFSSASASINTVIDQVIGADTLVSSKTFSGFSPDVQHIVQTTPGVEVASPARTAPAVIGSSSDSTFVTGVDPVTIQQVLKIKLTAGDINNLKTGTFMLDSKTAETAKLTIGSKQNFTFFGTPTPLTLVAIYEGAGTFTGYVVSISEMQAQGLPELDSLVYAKNAPGADATAVQADLQKRLAGFPTIQVQSLADFKDQISGQINRLLSIVLLLVLLALVVAFIGIVNTLALSVLERTREIGLLRAVGTTRGQIRTTVVLESWYITVYGVVSGIGLGILFGALLQQVLVSQGIVTLSVPLVFLITIGVVIAIAGLLVAMWPARRAARMDILGAIATE